MRTPSSPRPWYAIAAALSTITLAVHLILGGEETAAPLLASSELTPTVRFTLYYCWHLVTIAIAWLSVSFTLLCMNRAGKSLAVHAASLSLAFAAWDLLMIVAFGLSPIVHGQWILFLPVTVCGAIGALRDRASGGMDPKPSARGTA